MNQMEMLRVRHIVLIETLWNVNLIARAIWLLLSSRINRNIVECKYNGHRRPYRPYIVLIETLWNVNQVIYEDAVRHAVVLIETLWNVNEHIIQLFNPFSMY